MRRIDQCDKLCTGIPLQPKGGVGLHLTETIALQAIYGMRSLIWSVFKKTMNISTVRATPETKEKFERTVKELGFKTMAHFFTRSMETLLEQVDAGQALRWPLRFEKTKEEAPQKASSRRGKSRITR
jgi:hypothetical protein